jgi:hypothetical protein
LFCWRRRPAACQRVGAGTVDSDCDHSARAGNSPPSACCSRMRGWMCPRPLPAS